MNEPYKINLHFDEKGEELEKIIAYLIKEELEKCNKQFLQF